MTAQPGPAAGLGRGVLCPQSHGAVAPEYGVHGGEKQEPSQKLGS